MLEPLDPEAASSTHKSGSHAPGSAALDASPLIVLAAPPRRSLPSAPHRFSVSSSSWSAPFIKTDRHPHHLSRWSKIRGPLHRSDYALIAAISGWGPMMFITRVR